MARKFSELRAKLPLEAQQRSAQLFEAMREDLLLHELRRARELSQKALKQRLHVEQPAIAKMEKRTDMYISTLRAHIEALGGELEIVAKFPEGAVKIRNFQLLDSDSSNS
jgi:hypothetical protein